MNQLGHIISREFFTQVRKKSFFLFSIISPLIFCIPLLFVLFQQVGETKKNSVGIIDEANILQRNTLYSSGELKYEIINTNINSIKSLLKKESSKYIGILVIPRSFSSEDNFQKYIKYYVPTEKQINSSHIAEIDNFLNTSVLNYNLSKLKVSSEVLDRIKNNVKAYPIVLDQQQIGARRFASTLSYIVGMLMYLMLILYNNSLLRGIVEEKSSRIVEVFSLVVNPFYLMLGKILGMGMVAILQLILWVGLSIIYTKLINFFGTEILKVPVSNNSFNIQDFMNGMNDLPLGKILLFTPIFFIFGFLINGAITAAVAATADAKGESSLSFLSNLINILSIYVAMFSASYPDNSLAAISIFIPFLSPIVLPTLLPFDINLYKILISLAILILSFIVITYVASKIYRISILTYGNKPSLREIFKFIGTKNL